MSDRGIYARAVATHDLPAVAGDSGRTVMLVVPGHLVYLTPAEAAALAGQLRGAAGPSPVVPDQRAFTTGQVAKMCKVAGRTVCKWFDSGRLKGYRVPGSNDRRVPRESLVEFMTEYGFPLPPEPGGAGDDGPSP